MRIGLADTSSPLALMAVAWAAYAVALVLLSPGLPWHDLVALRRRVRPVVRRRRRRRARAAGLGAREALFVLLLTPLTSVAAATALALLARVVHTAADGLMAAGWWAAARRSPSVPVS